VSAARPGGVAAAGPRGEPMSPPPGSAVPVTLAAAIIGGGVAVGAVPELALLAQFTVGAS